MTTSGIGRSPDGRRMVGWTLALLLVGVAGLTTGYSVFGTDGAVVVAQSGGKGAALQGTASLSGTVSAARPFTAAQVYIRNVEKRMLYMVYTSAGAFRAVALLPGSYEINVQARGLESDVRKIVLKAGDHPTLELAMRDSASRDRFPSAVPYEPSDITLQSYEEIYPPGPGKDVLEQVCMTCHGENFFPSRIQTEAGWRASLDRMMGKALWDRDKIGYGEGILAPPATNFRFGLQDRKDVIAYLAKHFGPGSKRRAVRRDRDVPLDEAKLARAQFIEYYMPIDSPAQTEASQPQGEGGGLRPYRMGYTLQLDAEGNAWLVDRGVPNRLVKLDPRTGAQKDFILPDPHAGVHEILIDRSGTIWVPEFAGVPQTREPRLLGFNPRTEKWEHIIVADPDNVLRTSVKGGMHGTTVDSKGNLYMNWMLNGAIGKWDRATGRLSVFRIPTPTAVPYGMAIDANDNVWSALWNGGKLAKFDPTNNQWTEFTPPTHPGNMRRGPGVDAKNNVWVGIWAAGNRPGKLAKLDQTTGRFTEWSMPYRGAQPYEASADREDNIWFPDTGTPDRPMLLGRFDPRDQTFTFYPKPQFAADSSKLQHTADGAVWYSPRGGAPPGATGFGVLYPDKDSITTLGAFPLNGPPGYPFEVATSTRASR